MKETRADSLQVYIFENRSVMGASAATMAADRIRELLQQKEYINIVFAAAPSQNEFLAALLHEPVEWHRINAFHMDEYLGMAPDAPQQFGLFLRERFFSKVNLKAVHYLNGQTNNPEEECARYRALLELHPTDIVFMGIGENTHLAFNDPHVADFSDPHLVKVVDLDDACRQQQVNDGAFANIAAIPLYAFTLTIPALMRATYLYCMVPGKNKAQAVKHTLQDPITEQYPSTILRTHPKAILFLDEDSSAAL